jgi:hypothetical protein
MSIKLVVPEELSLEENSDLEKLDKKYFKNNIDSNQWISDFKTNSQIIKAFKYSLIVFKDEELIIGYSLVIPSNKKLMIDFLTNKISETQLIKSSLKNVNLLNFQTLYLCAVILLPEYRHKGYAKKGVLKSINYYKKLNKKIVLFSWSYSKSGNQLLQAISNTVKLPLKNKF